MRAPRCHLGREKRWSALRRWLPRPRPLSAGAVLHQTPLCLTSSSLSLAFLFSSIARARALMEKRQTGKAEDPFERTIVWFSLSPDSEWLSSLKHFQTS